MIGAYRGDDVLRHTEATFGGQLLQAGLPVETGSVVRDVGEHLVEEAVNHLRGRRQPVLDVDRAEQGLDRVGQDARLVAPAGDLFAPAEPQVRAEARGADLAR